MEKQATNQQIFKKMKELIKLLKKLESRVEHVEHVLITKQINDKFAKEEKEEEKEGKEEQNAEEEEEGSGSKGMACRYIDEIEYGDEYINESNRVVRDTVRHNVRTARTLDKLRKLTR